MTGMYHRHWQCQWHHNHHWHGTITTPTGRTPGPMRNTASACSLLVCGVCVIRVYAVHAVHMHYCTVQQLDLGGGGMSSMTCCSWAMRAVWQCSAAEAHTHTHTHPPHTHTRTRTHTRTHTCRHTHHACSTHMYTHTHSHEWAMWLRHAGTDSQAHPRNACMRNPHTPPARWCEPHTSCAHPAHLCLRVRVHA